MEGTLLVVTGPPGAGKSTVARLLAQHADRSVLVEGDQFFGFLATGGIAPWLPDAQEQNAVVVSAAAAATGRFVTGGYTTFYDGVVGPWFLSEFAAATGVAELDYVVLMPPLDVCARRVTDRVDHGFRDDAAARHMYTEFEDAMVESRHVLELAGEAPDGIAARITERRDRGELRMVGRD